MTVLHIYPHMIEIEDKFKALAISEDAGLAISRKYNGRYEYPYIIFKDLNKEDLINITLDKYEGIIQGSFITEDKYVYFYN